MKKLLSVLLAAVMCISLAFTAVAAETEEAPAMMVGGWSVNDDIVTDPMPDDAAEIFAKAMEGFVGVNYEPIAVLGAQVVSGLNIAYLCKATTVTATPETYLAVVVVYRDLEENATITKVQKIDFAKLLADEEAAEEVTFTLTVVNTITGEEESGEVVTAEKTLGDFMRTIPSCTWEDSEYGIFVTAIGDVANDDETASYWSYYIDGEYAMVGADECELTDGMEITWAYESYAE